MLLLAHPTRVCAQEDADLRGAARFGPLAWLVGEWQGYGIFPDDTTYIHKRFDYETAGVHLVERTIDIFPPEDLGTDYQLHQDFAVYYRDGSDYHVKSFFVEGFVWSSTVRVSSNGDTLLVATDQIENAPPTFRARITFIREGEDGFRGVFELAPDGQTFEVFERQVMRRIR